MRTNMQMSYGRHVTPLMSVLPALSCGYCEEEEEFYQATV